MLGGTEISLALLQALFQAWGCAGCCLGSVPAVGTAWWHGGCAVPLPSRSVPTGHWWQERGKESWVSTGTSLQGDTGLTPALRGMVASSSGLGATSSCWSIPALPLLISWWETEGSRQDEGGWGSLTSPPLLWASTASQAQGRDRALGLARVGTGEGRDGQEVTALRG